MMRWFDAPHYDAYESIRSNLAALDEGAPTGLLRLAYGRVLREVDDLHLQHGWTITHLEPVDCDRATMLDTISTALDQLPAYGLPADDVARAVTDLNAAWAAETSQSVGAP